MLNTELQALKAEIAEKEKVMSQEEMEWSQGDGKDDDDKAEEENIRQLEEINRMKHSGYNRENPQVQPVKKPELFKCSSCDLEFDSDENLKKHGNIHHGSSNKAKPRSIKCVSCNLEFNIIIRSFYGEIELLFKSK